MIQRRLAAGIAKAFRTHPIVSLLGPRQCGKTTLAREFAARFRGGPVHYFDLEDPTDLAKLEPPDLLLKNLHGLIVIDEVQRIPGLFALLRVLADRPAIRGKKSQFMILGSASRDLIRQSSETLAGRIEHLELTPFSLGETGADALTALWVRGGFPRSFLARSAGQSARWRRAFVETFLERDIPNLGLQVPARTLRRFWMMLVHYHGQLFNASEIGRSLGMADTTMRRYLDILTGTFMVRALSPWVENLSKRQVRSEKLFFRDSGILHSLLGVETLSELYNHPKLGASWEGFALEEVIRALGAPTEACFFWATHSEAELDLLVLQGGKRLGFEIKHTLTPKVTRSMVIAKKDLGLSSLQIVYPGDESFPLNHGIEAVGLAHFISRHS